MQLQFYYTRANRPILNNDGKPYSVTNKELIRIIRGAANSPIGFTEPVKRYSEFINNHAPVAEPVNLERCTACLCRYNHAVDLTAQEFSKLKATLSTDIPAVLPSINTGYRPFEVEVEHGYRHNDFAHLWQFTQVVHGDIDVKHNDGVDFNSLFTELCQHYSVYWAYRSKSGGIKFAVTARTGCNANNFTEYANAMAQVLYEVDPAVKLDSAVYSPNELCFLNLDPTAYYTDEAFPVEPLAAPPPNLLNTTDAVKLATSKPKSGQGLPANEFSKILAGLHANKVPLHTVTDTMLKLQCPGHISQDGSPDSLHIFIDEGLAIKCHGSGACDYWHAAAALYELAGLELPKAKAGRPRKNADPAGDVRAALQARGYTIRYNERFSRIEIKSADPIDLIYKIDRCAVDGWAVLADPVLTELRGDTNLEPGYIKDLVELQAYKESSVDPMAEYLDTITAERNDELLERTFIDGYNAADTPYNRAVGLWWLPRVVRRIMEAGCFEKQNLVLLGPPDTGKSSGPPRLLPDGYQDVPAAPYNSDTVNTASNVKDDAAELGGVFMEFAEGANLRKGTIEQAKAFLSRPIHRGRRAYGRLGDNVPCRGVYIITLNPAEDAGLPVDSSGALDARFVTVNVNEGADPWTFFTKNRTALWAAAKARYEADLADEMPTEFKESRAKALRKAKYADASLAAALHDILHESSLRDGISVRDGWPARWLYESLPVQRYYGNAPGESESAIDKPAKHVGEGWERRRNSFIQNLQAAGWKASETRPKRKIFGPTAVTLWTPPPCSCEDCHQLDKPNETADISDNNKVVAQLADIFNDDDAAAAAEPAFTTADLSPECIGV